MDLKICHLRRGTGRLMEDRIRKLIIIAFIVLLIVVGLSVFFWQQNYLNIKSLNIGSSTQYIGQNQQGSIVFIDNERLFYLDKNNDSFVINNHATQPLLSQDSNNIMYFEGIGKDTVVHTYSLTSNEDHRYTGFLNGFWVDNTPYLLKLSESGPIVYSGGTSLVDTLIKSETNHQVGNNIFNVIGGDSDESWTTYTILKKDLRNKISDFQLSSDTDIWWGTKYMFYKDQDNNTWAVDENGHKKNLGLNDLDKSQISTDINGKLLFCAQARDNNIYKITMKSYDIESGKTTNLRVINSVALLKDKQKNKSVSNLMVLNHLDNRVLLSTNEDYWLIDGVE